MQYILSSQGIRIHQEPASFAARLAAFSIDFMLMGIAWLFLLLMLKEGAFEGINGALVITLVILIPYLYPLISETVASGQTLGKKLLHIRVVDLEGGGPKISAFILRWLILPLDVFGSAASVLSAFSSPSISSVSATSLPAHGLCALRNTRK